jgi:GNAT superfamily N-acetyltransferase
MIAHSIRRARPNDAAMFPAIENSAGQAFRQLADLTAIADDEDMSVEAHLSLIAQGTSWVAVGRHDRPMGFLCAETGSRNLHIRELSVRYDCQRNGIGRRLVLHAVGQTRMRNMTSVTLTTFRDVPWNAPFYARLGFRVLSPRELTPDLADILRNEAEKGLSLRKRCAMRLVVAGGIGT